MPQLITTECGWPRRCARAPCTELCGPVATAHTVDISEEPGAPLIEAAPRKPRHRRTHPRPTSSPAWARRAHAVCLHRHSRGRWCAFIRGRLALHGHPRWSFGVEVACVLRMLLYPPCAPPWPHVLPDGGCRLRCHTHPHMMGRLAQRVPHPHFVVGAGTSEPRWASSLGSRAASTGAHTRAGCS